MPLVKVQTRDGFYFVPEAEDPRCLPINPWQKYTGPERTASISSPKIILRAVHHWNVLDPPSLRALTGFSTETIRWGLGKLLREKQIEVLGYAKGLSGKSHALLYVPSRKGTPRPVLPFFWPVRMAYIRDAREASPSGPGGLIRIGDSAAVRFHTIMVAKITAWIMSNLPYLVPLPRHILRKELGWYSEKTEAMDKKEGVDPLTRRRHVKTSIPDAYLVGQRFAVRVEVAFHRKSLDRYEAIFGTTNEGDLIFIVVDNASFFSAIQDLVRKKRLPVCPIRYGNREDLAAALQKVKEAQSDYNWTASRYRSTLIMWYTPATLDPALWYQPPPAGQLPLL